MEEKCIFYYDESFHSRLINKETYSAENFFDCFVCSALGYEKNEIDNIVSNYILFEEKYKQFYTTDELKSEIVTPKQYKYGIKTFNRNSLRLYSDYFNFLNNNKVIMFVSVTNKIEFILKQLEFSMNYIVNKYKFIYSLSKFISVYQPERVVTALFSQDDKIINYIIEFLEDRLNKNKNYQFKIIENNMINEFLLLLRSIDLKEINFNWNYDAAFYGLTELLKELNINLDSVFIYIDKEGNSNTLDSCKKMGFKQSEEVDSKESTGIRITDMFCGFVSRMMRAIQEDLKYDNNQIYDKPIILNEKWFDMTEEQFNLYKNIALFFKKYGLNDFSTYISIYCDSFACFIGLIYYIDNYQCYDGFMKLDLFQLTVSQVKFY